MELICAIDLLDEGAVRLVQGDYDRRIPARSDPVALATGSPGDVFLCHPFLVHAAQPHHGARPRFLAQPPLLPSTPYDLNRTDGAYSPVEIAIRRGLGLGRPSPDLD